MPVLDGEQLRAAEELLPGQILVGGVGSGKSRVALSAYIRLCGGEHEVFGSTRVFRPMTDPRDLYIITTARKRDLREWEEEGVPFLLGEEGFFKTRLVVDSWNNIGKYTSVKDAFFIFDEQRLVGSGAWVQAFYKIAAQNRWVLLSATPGDTWHDYIPVFVAHGFYANKTDFERQHVVYKRFSKYPQVDRYLGVGRLNRHRDSLLVRMDTERETVRLRQEVTCGYDRDLYRTLQKTRRDPETGVPYRNASALCQALRRASIASEGRSRALRELLERHSKLVVFYNYNYELEMIRAVAQEAGIPLREWNGGTHEAVFGAETPRWLYAVQYTAGAEGWNCTETDTMVFHSRNYSYKIMEQAEGRIDRRNTPFKELHYYYLSSTSPIERGVAAAVQAKRLFQEAGFARRYLKEREG